MDDVTRDRAAGALLAMAAGDALGAGYEFGAAFGDDVPVLMKGGGIFDWAPGEWTDDTSMAVPILEAAETSAAEGGALTDHLDDVAQAWHAWSLTADDVGAQTRAVLGAAARRGAVTRAALLTASYDHLATTGRAGGNGSLMRTAPVALAHLGDPEGIAAAARLVSDLTHAETDAGDACVLWCLAIDHAVATGALDVAVGLAALPVERQDVWAQRIEEAQAHPCTHFDRNGWVVHAFQAAWSAIHATRSHDEPLRSALEMCVRAGGDTDTVACIAGQLVGAAYGASCVPGEWVQVLHGWPGLTGLELAARGTAVAEASWLRWHEQGGVSDWLRG